MFVPPATALKGRGTAWAIEHRFNERSRSEFDDGWGTLEQAALEEQSAPGTVVLEENVRGILSGNDSPDIGFDLSINPYRGCEHGCVYCYARPTHSYLNLSPGLDFETRIVAKVNAAERLREALSAKGYTPLQLNIGSVTDAYQPAERRLKITRSVIEVLSEARHPFPSSPRAAWSSATSTSSHRWRRLALLRCTYPSLRSTAPWRARWSRALRRRTVGCARSKHSPARAFRWA